jgi:hypothetical protein
MSVTSILEHITIFCYWCLYNYIFMCIVYVFTNLSGIVRLRTKGHRVCFLFGVYSFNVHCLEMGILNLPVLQHCCKILIWGNDINIGNCNAWPPGTNACTIAAVQNAANEDWIYSEISIRCTVCNVYKNVRL